MNSRSNPPSWTIRLLRWFCKPWYVDAIEGDLLELYYRDQNDHPGRAKRKLIWNTFRFFQWRYIKDLEDFQPNNSAGMFKNYFRVSLRSMRKNLTQSILNILGLSVGITCCMLILMHLSTQVKYDKHISDLDRIYRVVINGGGPYTPARLVTQMRSDFAEIETGTRVSGPFEGIVNIGDGFVRQEGCILADSTFFEVFPTTFLNGSPETALNRPNTVVLTESVASKLFPGQSPIGDRFSSDGVEYEITAIVSDPPKTTTIPYQAIISIPRESWATQGYWTGNNFFSYLKVKENADVELLEAKFPQFVERHIAPDILAFNPQFNSFEEYLESGHQHFFSLVPMKDIHLHHPRLTLGNPGSFSNLVVFSMVAIFILVIACINYINMSTARSSLRAKEIGMRKVLGSVRKMIAQQFLVESFFITFIALALGIILSLILLPYFNSVSNSDYTIADLINGRNVLYFIAILLFAGLISGSYPAFYLSSFKPIMALKGESVRGGNQRVRQALVVFQFAISIFLIAATLIVYLQVSHMSTRKLGLNSEQTLIIHGTTQITDQYGAFKNELISNKDISEVGISSHYPSTFLADWYYNTVEDNPVQISPFNIFTTAEILDVWGLNLKEGRFFDEALVSDTASIVVNDYLVKSLGWEEPIGKSLTRGGGSNFRIIGVVENFVTGSARRGDAPIVFRTFELSDLENVSGGGYLMVKVDGNYANALTHIEEVWSRFADDYPFESLFLNDSFNRLYEVERRFGRLFTAFSIIAVLIACIGLFALASFTLERKKKEIAVRKVMGANVSNVMTMIGKYFLVLIGIAGIVALPTVYFLGETWLEDYSYRIDIGFIHLTIPLILVLLISFITIGFQTYRSATSNPVNALREE